MRASQVWGHFHPARSKVGHTVSRIQEPQALGARGRVRVSLGVRVVAWHAPLLGVSTRHVKGRVLLGRLRSVHSKRAHMGEMSEGDGRGQGKCKLEVMMVVVVLM